MSNFDKLLQEVDALRSMCFENLGSKEISEISVDLPKPPLDELYFRKAISWCYVFLNETGPFIRFTAKLLRTDPSASKTFGKLKNFVDCARTVHAHNLLEQRPEDAKKRRTNDIWVLDVGGEPIDWQKCCRALIENMNSVICLIKEAYAKRCENDGDRESLWQSYKVEKLTHWDAHEFDSFVESAASETNISGLNSTQFRKDGDRVERWRKLVAMFDTREAATLAIERAIRTELQQVFGGIS
jgi:hypothetical protein